MKYILQGLDCPNCAAKIERELNKLDKLKGCVVNFPHKSIELDPQFEQLAQKIIEQTEPGVTLTPAKAPGRDQDEASHHYDHSKAATWFGIIKIVVTVVLFTIGLIFRKNLHNNNVEYVLFLSAYFLVGWPVISTAFRNIVRGKFFDEHFLMTIATGGAIMIHELPEAVGVMLFYAVGELFQDIAVSRSRRSISALMNLRPDYANLVIDGISQKVRPEEVKVGQMIEIKPGEKVPLDGEVVEGSSFVDTSALTGESVPRGVEPGDTVLAGVINTNGLLRVRVEREFSQSSVAKILELVENASARKAPTEKFITRFAAWYTPAVVVAAALLVVIPPLVVPGAEFSTWIYRALVLLVISCPCALVVSIPLGYFGGIGASSRSGILVKGANFLDALTRVHTVVFDKTGTLTRGVFKVKRIVNKNGFSERELLRWAALAELHSSHPIGKSIIETFGENLDSTCIEEYQDIKGYGIKAKVLGRTILAGNDRLLHRENIEHEDCNLDETVVYVAVDGRYAGYLTLGDEIREDAIRALKELSRFGVEEMVMLTGDDKTTAERIAKEVGIKRVFAELLPEDKVEKVEELQNGLASNEKLVFVGDGINDAPVITRADIGVAMGGLGSDAAIEAADVVLMEDKPRKLPVAIKIALKTRKIVTQNIVMALGVKGIFLVIGAIGAATMWEAVFADVGVSLLAVLNAMRVLKR